MNLLPPAIVLIALTVGGGSTGPALRMTETFHGPAGLQGPANHLRQGYGGPPKLYAKAEAGHYVQTQAAPQQPSPQQQSEFVPISQLPPQDQLPAAPLLISAYVVVWVALFGYLFSVARRLGVVQREVERLETDLKRAGRL